MAPVSNYNQRFLLPWNVSV